MLWFSECRVNSSDERLGQSDSDPVGMGSVCVVMVDAVVEWGVSHLLETVLGIESARETIVSLELLMIALSLLAK